VDRCAGEEVRKGFVAELRSRGWDVFEREGFLKRRDQVVYLVQKGDVSGVMFIKVLKDNGDLWDLNARLFDSFQQLAASDENSELFVVLLESSGAGYLLKGDEFEALKPSLRVDEDGEFKIHRKGLDCIFQGNRFVSPDDFFERLGSGAGAV